MKSTRKQSIFLIPAMEIHRSPESRIVFAVCNGHQITPNELRYRVRDRGIVTARQMAFKMLKINTKMSLAKIGEYLGGFDHATVLHGIKTMNNLIDTDKAIREKYFEIFDSL